MSISYPDNTQNRQPILASGITDSTLLFDVVGGGIDKQLSLVELKKTANIVVVANVAALYALTYAIDNQLYTTLGYTTEGSGANTYRYDAASTATVDGVFVIPGLGGAMTFHATTGAFTGTAGTGRFIATGDHTFINVLQGGAVADGVTAQHVVFRRLLAALPNGGTLYIPAGTYATDAAYAGPNIVSDGITIRGDGKSTILVGTRTTDDVGNQYYNAFEASGQTGLTIKDIRFEGYVCGLYADQCSDITVQNISGNWYIANASKFYFDKALFFDKCDNVRVESSHFENFTFAVYFGGTSGDRSTNCTVTGCTFEHTRSVSDGYTAYFPVGVYIYYADVVTITGNSFLNIYSHVASGTSGTGMGYGVYEGDGKCTSLTVTGNTFENRGRGLCRTNPIYATMAEAFTCSGNTIRFVRPKTKQFTVNDGTDTITCYNHGYSNGDGVQTQSGGTLPSGITLATGYYVINASTDTFQISTTLGGGAVDITSSGSGTHVVHAVQNTGIRFNTYEGEQVIDITGNSYIGCGYDYAIYILPYTLRNSIVIDGNSIAGGMIRCDQSAIHGVVTADSGTNRLSLSAHKFNENDAVVIDTTGSLPSGATSTQTLYVTNTTTNDFQVSATRGGAPIDITSTGSGTHTVYPADIAIDLKIANNHINDCWIPAIQLTATSDLSPIRDAEIQNNHINRCGHGAIIMNAGCLRTKVVGNTIIDCNLLNKSASGSAICLFGKSYGCYVSGNTARNTLAGGGHAKYFMEHVYNANVRLFKDLIFENSIERMETAQYLRFPQASPTTAIADINYGDQVFRCPPSNGQPHYWTCELLLTPVLSVDAVATDTTINVVSTSSMTAGDLVLFINNPYGLDWQHSDTTKWHATTVSSVTDGTHFVVTDAIPASHTYVVGKSEIKVVRFSAAGSL